VLKNVVLGAAEGAWRVVGRWGAGLGQMSARVDFSSTQGVSSA